MDPKALFLEHLGLIDRICQSTCRRNGLFGDDASDFVADVRLKLIESDYAVFQKFRGRSSVGTYLSVVIGNLFRDYRVKHWGKWRPSARARTLGAVAVLLETLLYRDGHSLEQASRIIESNTPHAVSAAELRALAERLSPRVRRRVEGDHALEALPAVQSANGPVLDRERADELDRVHTALERVLATLPDEEQVLIRMRYLEGFTVAEIARTLGLEQRPLYDRVERDLRLLRERLEADGIRGDVLELS